MLALPPGLSLNPTTLLALVGVVEFVLITTVLIPTMLRA